MKKEKTAKTKKAKTTVKPIETVAQEVTPVVKEPVVPVERYITRDEQMTLEDLTSGVEKARLSASLAEQVTANKNLELQLAQRTLRDAQLAEASRVSEYKQRAKAAGDQILRLKAKYGVSGNFQYDPLSGRIVSE